MFRIRLLVICLALVLAGHAHATTLGPSLQAALADASPGDIIEVVVTFDNQDAVTPAQVAALEAMDLAGIYFHVLPMAGVLATPAQVEALAGLTGVRSLWLNEQVELENSETTALTGTDRLRTDPHLRNGAGLPVSGMGVGIMINDSGIDGTHADLRFPDKTVQNVYAGTNLNAQSALLPITWIEGVPDTDIGSGHGTHVAGIAAGTGAASGGQYAGAAPGAHLIGYGSGAVLFILDTLGAYDYALINRQRYNIRVINNSWGTPADVGSDFDPDHPISVATKRAADVGTITVFSAGNSGSLHGTITGSYKKAPWVVNVANATKQSLLSGSSSRGSRSGGGEVTVDGETFAWHDRPNVSAPGTAIVSTMSNTNALADPVNLHYASASGTSMASPHVAGVVALMLEANPLLGWQDVVRILEATASNLPGYADWEVGAGMVNAHAAVAMARGARDDYGATVNMDRQFNATLVASEVAGPAFELSFTPVLLTDVRPFDVAAGMSTVIARASVPDNTVALVLTDPDGNRYASAISLPLLGSSIGVTAPAVPGQWTIEVRGIGAVSGVALDPLGLTNGTALPGTVDAEVSFIRIDGFTGLDDIEGHAAQGLIERAVELRAADSRDGGVFMPDSALTRGELADYLMSGAGIGQFRPTDGGDSLFDAFGVALAAAEGVTARGMPLRDIRHLQRATVPAAGDGIFDPDGAVSRALLAYALVQALGLEAQAGQVREALGDAPITVEFNGQRVDIEDTHLIPPALRGHVQLALDFQLMAARFSMTQGPFEPLPTLSANFHPREDVTRASYAFSAVNYVDRFRQAQ